MTDLIKNAVDRLETLLRYVAPGFVALCLLFLFDPQLRILIQEKNFPMWIAVLSAVLAGIGLYAVHTGVLLRLVFWRLVVAALIMWSPWAKKIVTSDQSITEVMFNLDTERWKRRASADASVNGIQKELDRWAAMVNLLYCTAYVVLIAPLLASQSASASFSCYSQPLFIGVLLFLVASISNYAMTERAFWAQTEYPGGTNPNAWLK